MSHRIAHLLAPLLRNLRRRAWKRNRAAVPVPVPVLVRVPGVDVGSCGIPASCTVVTR